MALLPWTRLNPTVKINDTAKKFFNKFLYKAVVFLPGGNLIRNVKFSDMQFLLEERLSWHGHTYNYGGSWAVSPFSQVLITSRRQLEQAKIEQLEYWRDAAKELAGKFAFRVEEPFITVYSDDETALYNLIKADPRPRNIVQIFKPKNSTALAALDRGEIILKKETDYNYRVCFKEGKFDATVIESIHNLLLSQGTDIKMTKSCKKNMSIRLYWFTSTYFYAKDLHVATMIGLICPDIISGIYKIARV